MSSQRGSDWSSGRSLWHSACPIGAAGEGWTMDAGLWCYSDHQLRPVIRNCGLYFDDFCLQLGSLVRITPWNGWCLLPPSSQAAISNIGKSKNQPSSYLHFLGTKIWQEWKNQIKIWHLKSCPFPKGCAENRQNFPSSSLPNTNGLPFPPFPKDVLYTYGFYLGLAFQIADDVLDFTGGR